MKSPLPPLLLAPLLLACLCLGAAVSTSAAGKPNIVFILADDLGYADIGLWARRTLPPRTSTGSPPKG